MNSNIKYLVEDYFTNTEQLTNTMKNTAKAQKKYEKENDGRHMFLMHTMGKPLYNKVLKHGAVGTFVISRRYCTSGNLYKAATEIVYVVMADTEGNNVFRMFYHILSGVVIDKAFGKIREEYSHLF